MATTDPMVLFAGGGTGGTVGPGIAIAERLVERQPNLAIRFLCSDRAVDGRLLDPGGWSSTPLPARSPSLRPGAAIAFARGWVGTRRRVGRMLADLPGQARVVALGGFVAPPVVAEAVRRGIPVDLINLDAVAGRANRWMASRATRVYSAVPTDLELDHPPIGVPLRRAAMSAESPAEARSELGLDPARRTLLVTGASQGARSLDRFLADLVGRGGSAWKSWQVLHLAGDGLDDVTEAYRRAGVQAVVRPFLDRMGLAWSAADVALSRGGASSVAEIAMSRTPAIIVPYPWHADRHQARNAASLEELGAVEIHDDPVLGDEAATNLATTLEAWLDDLDGIDRRRAAFPKSMEDSAAWLARAILADPVERRSSGSGRL